MADKTTTLKTKTNDNVYPKVIGESRKDAFADSSTITHHFYDQTHKVGFQIANETNIKIQNSLQKPAGLTKTELVGVGTNGQENIEIGDNLTLANGKLSATGGGSGGNSFDFINTEDSINYTGTISGTKPVILSFNNYLYYISYKYRDGYSMFLNLGFNENSSTGETSCEINAYSCSNNKIRIIRLILQSKTYYHFITIYNNTSIFYLTYQNTSKDKINTFDYLKLVLAGKCFICTGHTDSEKAEYISGEGGHIIVGVVDNSDNSTSGITIDSSYTITDLVSSVY